MLSYHVSLYDMHSTKSQNDSFTVALLSLHLRFYKAVRCACLLTVQYRKMRTHISLVSKHSTSSHRAVVPVLPRSARSPPCSRESLRRKRSGRSSVSGSLRREGCGQSRVRAFDSRIVTNGAPSLRSVAS